MMTEHSVFGGMLLSICEADAGIGRFAEKFGLNRFGFTRAILFGQGRCSGFFLHERGDARDVVQPGLCKFR
jgi:hypothetical protein